MSDLKNTVTEKWNENKKFLAKLKKSQPRDLDKNVSELHDEEFSIIDCLECANCCKTTGPLFTQKDVQRIAKHLRIKPGIFIETYLRIDEDQDMVLKSVPCTFLSEDNYCSIYTVRPKACSEFPHTNRKKFHQLNEITLNNIAVCPAVFNIVEALKKLY